MWEDKWDAPGLDADSNTNGSPTKRISNHFPKGRNVSKSIASRRGSEV